LKFAIRRDTGPLTCSYVTGDSGGKGRGKIKNSLNGASTGEGIIQTLQGGNLKNGRGERGNFLVGWKDFYREQKALTGRGSLLKPQQAGIGPERRSTYLK